MTEFQKAVLRAVQIIPAGRVASYGQIAAYVGSPRAARQVGWTMRSMEGTPNFPWWRVLNNAGVITIKGTQFASARLQKELLQAEGVEVSPSFELTMSTYRFRPTADQLGNLKLDPHYAATVIEKFL